VPAAPLGLAVATIDSQTLQISWNATANAGLYKLERATSADGPWTQIYFNAANQFTDTVSPATTYFYRVRGDSAGGDSPYSTIVQGTSLANVPTGLTATPTGPQSILLTWNGVPGATGYKLERAPTLGGPWNQISSGSATAFPDSGDPLAVGSTFYYRVRSSDAGGDSGPSAAVFATPKPSIWQNQNNNLDTSGDGIISGLDALEVINALITGVTNPLPQTVTPAGPPPYIDVTGDGLVTPLDALTVIAYLNQQGSSQSASVAATVSSAGSASPTYTPSSNDSTTGNRAIADNSVVSALASASPGAMTPVAFAMSSSASVIADGTDTGAVSAVAPWYVADGMAGPAVSISTADAADEALAIEMDDDLLNDLASRGAAS
jgi:hypothetical protein